MRTATRTDGISRGIRCAPAIPLLAALLLGGSAHAACTWVDSITDWDGSLAWSYSHHATWSDAPRTLEGTTRDQLSATFHLDALAPGIAQGPMEGTLKEFGRTDVTGSGAPSYTEVKGDGPLDAYGPPPPQIMLVLDSFQCTYTFLYGGTQLGVDGTSTVGVGGNTNSVPTIVSPGGLVIPPQIPIPPTPQPLTFSGQAEAATLPPLTPGPDPYYDPPDPAYGSADFLGDAQLGFASAQWSFEPGGSLHPVNDSCAGATLLTAAAQDTSFATALPSDPTPSCGGGDRSVWFLVQADEAGIAQVETPGSDYGTVVSVWPMAQACGAITTQIACGAGETSFPVEAGVSYRVQIARTSGSGGSLIALAHVPEPAAGSGAAALLALAWRQRRRGAPA